MMSAYGRSYNVGIGSTGDIRRESSVASLTWRGHSDIEVLAESVASRGIAAATNSLSGMYTRALGDAESGCCISCATGLELNP